jgi:hypothetical protein
MITIKDIKPYPKNPKNHPDKQIDVLAKVVMLIGWRQNVEVNQEGVIVAGHGRFMVWEKYKDDPKMPPIWITDDMGNTIHGEHSKIQLTKEQETMWRIADNKLAELAEWSLDNFNAEFQGLPDDLKSLTGFNDLNEDINDVEMEWEGMPEVNAQKIEGAFRSILIHFEKEEDVKNFADLTDLRITENTRFTWFPFKERENIKDLEFKSEEEIIEA